jgi:hypothetical protein
MLMVTTPTLEGKKVVQYLGLVTGKAILGANVFRAFFASIQDIVGGRSASDEKEFRKAKKLGHTARTGRCRCARTRTGQAEAGALSANPCHVSSLTHEEGETR